MPAGLLQNAKRAVALYLCGFVSSVGSPAQSPRGAPAGFTGQASIIEGLDLLVAHSGVILSGEVLPDKTLSTDQGPQIIRLRVLHSIRGVKAGDVFSFAQWPGAEQLGLKANERVILFLHEPNGAGISSSALGAFGLLKVGGGDLVDIVPLEALARQISNRRPLSTPNARARASLGDKRLSPSASKVPEPQLIAMINQIVTAQNAETKSPLNRPPSQSDAVDVH